MCSCIIYSILPTINLYKCPSDSDHIMNNDDGDDQDFDFDYGSDDNRSI